MPHFPKSPMVDSRYSFPAQIHNHSNLLIGLRLVIRIGADGRIGLCVDEQNRSWCSSSRDNDQRAVTIECASDLTEPYTMNDKVYASLVNLCVDICRRNGKKKLVWIADRDKALRYEVKDEEMLLTVHRWFARKSCPGNWLMED